MEYNPLLVGEHLRNLRKSHHLTQMELAEQLGISFIHYSQIEQGRHRISINLLFRIMTLFKIDANSILGIRTAKEKEVLFFKIEKFLNDLQPQEKKQIYATCEILLDTIGRKRCKVNVRKKKFNRFIPCVVILSVDEQYNELLIEKKENKQLNYINDYAKAHNLLIMKIIRKGCSGKEGKKRIFHRAISFMEQGKAEALLIANMASISFEIADAYHKIGIIKEKGFRIITVDEGELDMKLHLFSKIT